MSVERVIQYGSLWPEGHFARKIAESFAQEIADVTNSRIRVMVTPPMPDEELTKDVISGKIEMTSGHAIQDYVPELGLGYLPYLNRSFDEFRHIWTLGSSISDAILAKFHKRQIPVVVLGYSVIGFRDMILRDRAITHAQDFEGLKVRNDGSTTSHDTFVAFGADPRAIEYHQVKQALQRGEVDAAANTSFNLIYMQWHQVTNNVSLTSHQILTNLEIVNVGFWNSLDADDQNLFRNAMRIACDEFASTAKLKRGEAIQQLGDEYGLAVNEVSDEAKAQLATDVEPMKNAFVEKCGLQKEYAEILSSLSNFSRSN